ncbi:MAG TPA: NAD(P)/FAD-dependent oxidoreductase [Gemmatimonadota bacterium]|nr:NAD(P)/FAD-dependent oxidoreductase [Gemmatimonadota bacterium]
MSKPGASPDGVFDVTILGGGPTGLFGVFYAGMRHMRTLVIDALSELGGQLTALYPEKYVYDVGGFPKILARELAEGLIEQALQFHPDVGLEETAVDLEPAERDAEGDVAVWRLRTDKHERLTRTLVISAGIGAFEPRRLKVEGVERFEGRGMQYLVKDKMAFAGRRVLIVGGGDSAFDWADNLRGIADTITLIHRRDGFRAHEGTVQAVMASGDVDILTFHEVRAVAGDDRVESVTIFDNRTDQEKILDVDALLVNIGFKADLGPVKSWGLAMEKNGIVVNERMETSLPGVYAAGDVAHHGGKLPLIATGFGEVAIAVNYAKARIEPGARAFPGHSTEEKWRDS